MGAAFYPVLEHPIDGCKPELAVSGKALSRNTEAVERLCQKFGLKSLMDFYSESAEETAALIGEDPEYFDDFPPLQWFDPADGLRTVQTLIKNLASNNEPSVPGLIQDLQSLENVFLKAQQAKTRFRLRADI